MLVCVWKKSKMAPITVHTVTVILSTNAADVVRWLNSLTSLDKICEA